MSIMHTFIRNVKNIKHLLGAFLACLRYGFPSRKLTVIGVTGTDGKTTTSHLIYHILKEAGYNVSVSTTVFADIAGETLDTGLHVTTQSPWQIQANMAKAVKKGCTHFVLETTSHGIDQYRVWGVRFALAVLTNITPEHLDYHKTFKAYLRTKVRLLQRANNACINSDADCFEDVRALLDEKAHPYKTYSILSKKADYYWDPKIATHLHEEFNRQNIMAGYAVCRELGLSAQQIRAGIGTFTLPKGRFDTVYNRSFRVIIDFAHTPHSIRQLLKACDTDIGRIIHIFGSAGLRDAQKRPDMGRASGEYADFVIVTEEDYRTEDFMKIAQAVSHGLYEQGFSFVEPHQLGEVKKGEKQFTIIKNREKAIEAGIELAKKGDTVLVTGKGHEQSLARGTKEFPWDDYKAVASALKA